MLTPPHHLRRLHERLILERIVRAGEMSRAQLAKVTGLSAPTTGKVADQLIAQGLLEEAASTLSAGEADDTPAVMGRPARQLRLNRTVPRLIALQVGVRHTRLAALPVAGPTQEQWAVEFPTPQQASSWITRVEQAAKSLKLSDPWAVMVSVPGVVDERQRKVLLSPNLHWLEQVDWAAMLSKVWPAPVCLVQEIRALAMGHLVGEPTSEDYLLVDFGEGVGAAAVTHGRLYVSPIPLGGELGHTPVLGNDRPCGCGAIGCVETLVSRPGLMQSFREQVRGSKSGWNSLVRHVGKVGIEPWLARSLDAVSATIAGAINVLGVRQVILTGSIVELGPAACGYVAKGVERAAMWARFGQVFISTAPRRRAAGLAAAAIDRVLLPEKKTELANTRGSL